MTALASRSAAEFSLDFLNLFVANIQTGFGPFVAVYLTTRGWTQTSIGVALSIGTIFAMISQVPAGALVDAARRKSTVAALSLLAFTASALLFAIRPLPLTVYIAEALHGFSSCTLGPAVAALSLALVGTVRFGPRLGRNARFSSIGNAMGAALMGACGYYFSSRAVFLLAAALTFPAIASVWPLRALDARRLGGHRKSAGPWRGVSGASMLLRDRRLLIFSTFAMAFTFANAALLPLASVSITAQAPARANLLIAAFIVLPQLVVAAISPSVGRVAQSRGRRLLLIVGLAAVGARGALFAIVADPNQLIPIQLLDGIAGACFGILVPLVVSDLAAHTGHFNFALGVVGFAVGIGATLSTSVAGFIADQFGEPRAVAMLGAAGCAAMLLAVRFMPETRPSLESEVT